MSTHPDLANPDYEPSDEELEALMHRAFSRVASQNDQRLSQMRERIAAGQADARRRLAEILASRK